MYFDLKFIAILWNLYITTTQGTKWLHVVSVDRWSLYRGAVVLLEWPMEHPTVVTIDRWSLYRGAVVSLEWLMNWLTVTHAVCMWVVFKAGFTVCNKVPLYTFHCTCSTVHIPLYKFHRTHSTVHVLLYTFHCTRSTVHVPLYTFYCTRSTVHVPLYTFHRTRSTVHIPPYMFIWSLHSIPLICSCSSHHRSDHHPDSGAW
jgi:hypothetical protein